MSKEDLHRLVDELPASTEETALRILRCLRDESQSDLAAALAEDPEDPFLRALAAAPEDDEPETPEEAEAVRVAIEESDRGESIPWEEVKRRLADMP